MILTQLGKKLITMSGTGMKSYFALKPTKTNINIKGLNYVHDKVGDVVKLSKTTPSVQDLRSLTKEEAENLLKDIKKHSPFNASRQQIELEINGTKFNGQFIGGGGTKSAYRVAINNDETCVLLPSGSWGNALYEPENTAKLKELGLLANDYCKIVKVKVDGQMFPALITKPYDKHSFNIFDMKNPNDYLDRYINPAQITENSLPEICSALITDVKKLADNHIDIGSDAVNLAIKDGKLRLFLNDLPYKEMTNNNISSNSLERRYLENVLNSIQARFSWGAYDSNPVLQRMDNIFELEKLVNELLR